MKKKLIAGITLGDVEGVGPEVILKALNDRKIRRLADFLIIGDGSPLNCIDTALKLIKAGKIDVLITAPVNKAAINKAHPKSLFTGHTEYLARAAKTKDFAMMLIGGPLRVSLVTRHIALKDVPGVLTKGKIEKTICLTALSLKKYFRIRRPRIAVCGLNPHSGEQGLMGQEERRIIQPAIRQAKKRAGFASIQGPLPADTVFHAALQGKFDAVVAMYHDQGLIPLKALFLHQGVNLTLGLPFVRTSCDHGTAYDIAGKDKADPGSMKAAIKLAVELGELKRCC
jgi:4-hydroxythreonine-4-phosphate dehydrogenase